MPRSLEVESTLTDRYQTTIPRAVREVLDLRKQEKILYTISGNGEVVLTRSTRSREDDPVLEKFLDFLSADLTKHPERLRALDPAFVQRLQLLVDVPGVALK